MELARANVSPRYVPLRAGPNSGQITQFFFFFYVLAYEQRFIATGAQRDKYWLVFWRYRVLAADSYHFNTS